MSTAAPPAVRVKPSLRGVMHQVTFLICLVAAPILTLQQPPGVRTWAIGVYTGCLTALFGISAAYHRPTWQPAARARMRRLDHAGIYLQIAGTYTPMCLLAIGGETGRRLLWLVWLGAAAGVVKSLLWVHAPKPLSALLYVGLGWLVVSEWPTLRAVLSTRDLALLFAGGVLYTLGAVIYSLKRPDPVPKVFGYHEIFHTLVVAAAICHFVMIQSLLT